MNGKFDNILICIMNPDSFDTLGFYIISILAVGVIIAIYVKSLKLQKQCYKLENLSINKILRQSNTYKGRTIAIKPAEIDAGDGGTIKSYSIIMNLRQKCEVSLFDKLKYIFSLYYGSIGTYSITGRFPPWPKDPTNEKHTLQRFIDVRLGFCINGYEFWLL